MLRHYFNVPSDGKRPDIEPPDSDKSVKVEVEGGTYPPPSKDAVTVFVCLDEYGKPTNEAAILDNLKATYTYLGTVEVIPNG